MRYVGVDCYRRNSYVTCGGWARHKVVREGQIANAQQALATFSDAGAQNASAVLEGGRGWPVMYERLAQLVGEVT